MAKQATNSRAGLLLIIVFLFSTSLTLIQDKQAEASGVPEPQHETIDGFVSFYVTGEVQLEATPMLYDARNSRLVVSVMVKKGPVEGDYDHNKISVYHFIGNQATEIDWVKSYEKDPLQDLIHYDPDFVFDFTGETVEKTYQVVFSDTEKLETNFAISAYISID